MASESSFDVVSKVDHQEVDNALQQASKELAQRFDFRGTDTTIEWSGEDGVSFSSSTDDRIKAAVEVFKEKLVKRGISLKAFEAGEPQSSGKGYRLGGKIIEGIDSERESARAAERFRRIILPVVLSRPAGVVWRVVGPAVALAAAPGRRAVRRAPGGPCADIAAQNALAASVREFMGHRSCMRQLEQLRVSDPVRSGLPVLVVAANGRLPRRGLSPWAQHVLRQARRFEPQGRVAVRVVSRSGHFVMLDQPRRTAELIASAAGG